MANARTKPAANSLPPVTGRTVQRSASQTLSEWRSIRISHSKPYAATYNTLCIASRENAVSARHCSVFSAVSNTTATAVSASGAPAANSTTSTQFQKGSGFRSGGHSTGPAIDSGSDIQIRQNRR